MSDHRKGGPPVAPRNVLFLMTDQHRADTLGCYGNPLVDTPRWTHWRRREPGSTASTPRPRSAPRPAPRWPPASTRSATAC
ncbi:hypothetical protein NKH18_41160 [Streptomyces sp. M10(2022)]